MRPKFCNKCGNAIKEGEKFCRKCGNPINIIKDPIQNDSPEGTVILGDIGHFQQSESRVKRGSLVLSFEEMLRGCTKTIDFGTGGKYEVAIPTGLAPGDIIKVIDTGIIDPSSGDECEIELTTSIG